jgi:hypothetical protein
MYMNIFGFWNESSEFPLFLMGKFALIYECFGLRARFRNELCSQSKVWLYLGLCKYTFAQRRNCLTTHFSERIPFVKRRTSVLCHHTLRNSTGSWRMWVTVHILRNLYESKFTITHTHAVYVFNVSTTDRDVISQRAKYGHCPFQQHIIYLRGSWAIPTSKHRYQYLRCMRIFQFSDFHNLEAKSYRYLPSPRKPIRKSPMSGCRDRTFSITTLF